MFPTFPVVLHFRGDSHDVVDFNKDFTQEPIPGLPPLNPARVVCSNIAVHFGSFVRISIRCMPRNLLKFWRRFQ